MLHCCVHSWETCWIIFLLLLEEIQTFLKSTWNCAACSTCERLVELLFRRYSLLSPLAKVVEIICRWYLFKLLAETFEIRQKFSKLPSLFTRVFLLRRTPPHVYDSLLQRWLQLEVLMKLTVDSLQIDRTNKVYSKVIMFNHVVQWRHFKF